MVGGDGGGLGRCCCWAGGEGWMVMIGGAGAKRGVGEIRGASAIGLIIVDLGRLEAFLFNQTGRVVFLAL